jgi:hypothetical protein
MRNGRRVWKHPVSLEFIEVDLGTVDPDIEDDP